MQVRVLPSQSCDFRSPRIDSDQASSKAVRDALQYLTSYEAPVPSRDREMLKGRCI